MLTLHVGYGGNPKTDIMAHGSQVLERSSMMSKLNCASWQICFRWHPELCAEFLLIGSYSHTLARMRSACPQRRACIYLKHSECASSHLFAPRLFWTACLHFSVEINLFWSYWIIVWARVAVSVLARFPLPSPLCSFSMLCVKIQLLLLHRGGVSPCTRISVVRGEKKEFSHR